MGAVDKEASVQSEASKVVRSVKPDWEGFEDRIESILFGPRLRAVQINDPVVNIDYSEMDDWSSGD